MTITIHNSDGSLVDINDTLGILLSEPQPEPDRSREETQRLGIPHRRPAADPERFEDRRSFAGADSVTGERPLLGVDEPDLEQERFNRFCADVASTRGRHRRTDQPGLFARLLRWGR